MTNFQCQMTNKFPISNEGNRRFDIHERALKFAVRAARFINKLPRKQSTIEYGKQLIRASASIGANLEEADGALSKKDFLNKIGISRKEAKESKYWLKLIREVEAINLPEDKKELDWLINEGEELKLILSSIIIKTKTKS